MSSAYGAGKVACSGPVVYTQPMRNLDEDLPAQMRQEAADRVARAQREYRRARYALGAWVAVVVAAVAVTVVALGIR